MSGTSESTVNLQTAASASRRGAARRGGLPLPLR